MYHLPSSFYHDFIKVKFFKNKNTSIRSSQGYRYVAAPGAGGSDPAVILVMMNQPGTSTVALIKCASRNFSNIQNILKKNVDTNKIIFFFGRSREPGYRYRYYGKSIDLDPVISP